MQTPKPGHYRVIYADPAYDYETWSVRGQKKTPHRHYACLSIADMASLPVVDWAAEDAVLLMWAAPDTFLEQAFTLIKAWGFTFKTVGFTWVKTLDDGLGYFEGLEPPDRYHFGQGYWTHSNPEICLLATRGRPYQYVQARDIAQLVVSPRREHSRKPDEIYSRIERLISGPYLEMFSRTDRAGWDSWGNETGKFGSSS